MRALAVFAEVAKRASGGTANGLAPFSTVALTRFSIQPDPCGEGRNAGSKTAENTTRLKASPRPPAIGFHALVGGRATATLSQPFQGKSRSLTVRGKIGDASP